MRKDIFLLALAAIIAMPYIDACTPEYLCGDWGSCSNGFQVRSCEDTACNTGNIVERRLCGETGDACTTNLQCSAWSECHYFGKTHDLLSNKLRFSGYQERMCEDLNRCADGFAEERKCTDSYQVKFVEVERCGTSLLVAIDANSNREISTISADAWKFQRLEIAFVQSNFSYCPSCYNGVWDHEEEHIDCGGNCKACVAEKGERTRMIIVSSSWALSILLILGIFALPFADRKNILRKSIYEAYGALDRGNKESLAKHMASIRKHYSKLKPEHRKGFDKEIDRLYRRI